MRFENRLRFLSVCVILFAIVLGVKLYFVQIVLGATYKDKAEHQYVAGADYFDRGSIFFTSKDGTLVPAATVKTGYTLAINPQIVAKAGNADALYTAINAAAPIPRAEFDAKAAKVSDPYEELAKRLPLETADALETKSLPGVSLYTEKWRTYPGAAMAAHVLGFIGYGGGDGKSLTGQYGLERYYEPLLRRSGDEAFVNFFAEIFSNIKQSVTSGESLEGDIVTTIEPSVQAALEEDLSKVEAQYSSEFSGGIIIDPKTGEIVAMAESPAYDPNESRKVTDASVFRDRLVEDRYEMGSIVKALTMAAGLDSGVVTADTRYSDPGCVTLNKKTFCNYDLKSHGSSVSMQEVLNHSLNTGAAFVESRIGNRNFADYMFAYGLASTTGIDLPNEGNSLVSNLRSNEDLNYAEASFGQGIAITPVQAVRALSTLANGGYLITPHLVREINYKIGGKKVIKPEKGAQVLKPSTSEEISRMLTQVVDVALKNGSVKLPNYSLAAKTGTAQIASPDGKYYADHYLHSFFGYFPSYDARFLIFLYTYYPKGVQYASETLTDTFIDMSKFLINYYNIAPDREAPPHY